MSSIKLEYGLKDNKIISISDIDEADRGIACNCVCPSCGLPLQAKLGYGKRQPHFSHDNSNCNPDVARQTALHIMAKEIIETEKTMLFPVLAIPLKETLVYKKAPHMFKEFPYNEIQKSINYHNQTSLLVCFDSVCLEKRISSIIPDIVVTKDDKKCLIEIAVTHFVDKAKEKKIKELGYPLLEIDLSELYGETISRDQLSKIIKENIEKKKWIYNPPSEEAISWANDWFQKEIERLNAEYATKELNAQETQPLELNGYLNNKQINNEYRRVIGREAVLKAFQPDNYRNLIVQLKNDVRFEKEYGQSYIKSESKVPPFYFNIPITGEFIFNCDRRVWQLLVFQKFVYFRKKDCFSQISLNAIKKFVIDQKLINWNFAYSPRINGKSVHLIEDVIRQYMIYLHNLGFVRCEYGAWKLLRPHTIVVDDEEYAEKLQIAIDSVDPTSPTVDDDIAICIYNLSQNQ